MEHETMEFDVIIVGAGPSGLSAAIKLKQLALASQKEITICILEKGAQVGAHILSGAVLEPRSLKELLPENWQQAPLDTPVNKDLFYFLTQNKSFKLPTPKPMHNEGNFIISLGELCKFLAEQAEALGCEIYPGFAAAEILYNDKNQVIGVATGDVGIDRQGKKSDNYQPGMHLLAKQTLFAEGCRGQLSQTLMSRYHLRDHSQPQTYGIGIKEIWQVDASRHEPGKVIHTVGWPLDHATYGGSFLYHLSEQRVAVGFVVGLDYKNPWLNPFGEFQRFKTHPLIKSVLTGGERIGYGARALNEGGWQSLPKLTFPGGALIGDAAGFLNVPKIKGIHTAMQSGMLAAQACFDALSEEKSGQFELSAYPEKINQSWLKQELYAVRNIRPGFKYGLFPGLINAALETYVTRGYSPWTLKNHADHKSLIPAEKAKKINYPKPDGVLTFDKLSSVFLSNTFHEENQPCHLKLKQPKLAIEVNLNQYASPESRYCPAAVYEIIEDVEKGPRLQINAQNCIHCKTCDIKDPRQNIVWQAPEGGGGPNYSGM
ncbi:TPA: electron transfer flavoprotein-ubiquinone oxidoreductase [Legionella pneumophila]|uniref:electron transfer flavoprotein-ubiquinone oxidoreductase n=1 Tax=Legionella pneumophila TaxID=446 RepID=UPI00026D9C6F|nr:electron transfer flavoprotein-ubiquinone oxidoreductase (ETF-QO) (ETF-ubiquinone oxidoreductase) (ETF dehydrogenase) (Electron-transferring-flavoprotein dehydrogenase) [Legionella pneumophila subsp. pneumophila]CZH31477.1 Electron transfer flavoprotein-ubiquinone oxidoreductase [Legionella pneumophila]CZI97493.1 Electron transfer flavoprotein-ubiquinone oxidoreductase [Legionella pneumophila]CZQ92936.1 Electron transfer flavoprotein-ubiquinone oxidoreductase [Legionella pneumophila]STX67660